MTNPSDGGRDGAPWSERDGGEDPARSAIRFSALAHRRSPLGHLLARRGLGSYRGYGEMLDALDRLAARGARLVRVGRSVAGEPLFAVHLGKAKPDGRTRTSVILSGVHPIEWIGIETHLALLERLLHADLGDRAVVSFPIVNPDGVLRVEQNLRTSRHRLVRHNARGVDLDRNFDAGWDERGILQRLLSFLYPPGSRPASEPEVEAIGHHLSNRRVDRALSLHSFGGAVLYPSAGSIWPVADAQEHRQWAKRIGRAADDRAYCAISAAWFSLGFTQAGLELDWFHYRHGALSLLVECSRGGFGLRPSRLIEPFAWYNPAKLEATTLRLVGAVEPFVRGARL